MVRRARLLALLSPALLLGGCLPAWSANSRSFDQQEIGNATVFDSDDLFDTHGNLLRVLATRLVNSQVVEADGCAALQLRAARAIFRTVAPGVYVDGQRAVSSCTLDLINTEDVRRVEVYPSGVTQRPGYHNHAGGLILVFLKDGTEEYAGN